jgi:pSer/pThr/pTyr-binding forkhead associated (FHA) protein
MRVAIEILSGAAAGRRQEFDLDSIRIGRAASNELVLDADHVAGEHVRVIAGVEGLFLEDLGSALGTWLVRGSDRSALGETPTTALLENGDVIELGGPGGEGTRLGVSFELEPDRVEIVESRPMATLGTEPGRMAKTPSLVGTRRKT